jgi:hypothetical protein
LGRSNAAVTRGVAKETELENELLSSDDDKEAVSSSNRLDSLQSKHKSESTAKGDGTACLDILVCCMTALLALVEGRERPSVEAM